jgi:hypothetical protein
MYVDDSADEPAARFEADVRANAMSVQDRIGSLHEEVLAGRLNLEPAVGERIVKMLAAQTEQVDSWLERSRALARRVPLGRNPVGEAMAGKFENRAGGEHASFAGAFTAYRQVLQDAQDAMTEAMASYRDAEDRNADTFRRLSAGSTDGEMSGQWRAKR